MCWPTVSSVSVSSMLESGAMREIAAGDSSRASPTPERGGVADGIDGERGRDQSNERA